MDRALVNSLLVTIPAVLLTPAAGLDGGVRAQPLRAFPGRRAILLLMLAGNLLPPQILLIPVARIMRAPSASTTPCRADRHPRRLRARASTPSCCTASCGPSRARSSEAATDRRRGRRCRSIARIILPLCRPALAALGALSFTWIFNDLLWAITVLRTETKLPVTAALLGLQGQFVCHVERDRRRHRSSPRSRPRVVFFAFQRHFVLRACRWERASEPAHHLPVGLHLVHPHRPGRAVRGPRPGLRGGRGARLQHGTRSAPCRSCSSAPAWTPARSACAPLGGEYGQRMRWYDVRGESTEIDGRAHLLGAVRGGAPARLLRHPLQLGVPAEPVLRATTAPGTRR